MNIFSKGKSLRIKLLVANIAVVLIVAPLAIILATAMFSARLSQQLQKRGLYIANHISQQVIEPILTRNNLILQALVNDQKESTQEIEYIFIMDERRKTLAHTFEGGLPVGLKEANIIEEDEEFATQDILMGETNIYDVTIPILKGEIGILRVGFSKESILKDTAKMVWLVINILLIVLILAIVLAIVISAFITRPILNLTNTARLISRGQLEHKVKVTTEDEIGELGNTFNKMVGDLRTSRRKLQEWSDTLEHKVDERTKELTKAKSALEQAFAKLKETQTELIQAEKMQVAGGLASGIAHEVKNPLTTILMGVDYISKVGDNNKKVSSTLKEIRTAVQRANDIVKGLLDFSRASQLNIIKQDLNSILDKSSLLIKNLLDKNHVELIKDFKEGLPDIHIDKNKINQVFVNLFINAVHAMPEGGKLTVRTYTKKLTGYGNNVGRRAEDTFKLEEAVAVVEIEDTGCGIPEDALGKIFDPFFTTHRSKGGTGLGLAIVKNILDMHQGAIYIKNKKEGQGVIVTVLLKA